MKFRKNANSLLHSFRYAVQGVWHTISHERNMRVHIVATIYVLLFSAFYRLNATQKILLCSVICLVLITELLNTSIEAIVNLLSPQYSHYAKIAKDTAAGAVLVSAVLAVLTGIWMFWDIQVFKSILSYFTAYPLMLVLLVLSVVLSALFILTDNREE